VCERADLPMDVVVLSMLENVGVGAGHAIGWSMVLSDPAIDYVWTLEHDCEPLPDCLDVMARFVADNPDVGVVSSRLARNNEEVAGERMLPTPGRGAKFTFNSTIFSRKAIRLCGPPRSDLFCGQEDWDYLRRLQVLGLRMETAPAWALHASKGDKRHGRTPSVERSYYDLRGELRLDLERGLLPSVPRAVARLLGGSLRIALRDDSKSRRVRARWRAGLDALVGRMGHRQYKFMVDVRR
jgi:GT2 family glycosyltransferase